jgi:predicted cupin superfamily sugar epimerase
VIQQAADLISTLQLAPHPEGGFYRQIYKSPVTVLRGKSSRAALTIIHFLLPAGHVSRWHRVESDEVWTHLNGEPLRLHRFDGVATSEHIIGGTSLLQVVPAGQWQAAEPLGSYALVACFVAPGFEFADFTLMSDDADAVKKLEQVNPVLLQFS